MVFVGEGGSAVGRSFETAGAELYCCWARCGVLYKLGCHRSLALVKGEGKASGAYAGGACTDKACVGEACADGDCADEACVDGACAGRACADRRSFETARARARAADDVKGVNERDLRRRLITYKLKGPSLLIYSLISLSNHSIGSSSWATSYSAYSTNLLFLLKTHTPLHRSSCLSSLIADLSASLNIYTLKLLKSS